MTTLDDPFMTVTDAKQVPQEKRFGVRGENQRYHMPLLPGEQGVKSGGNWVPSGVQSMTNLVGAFEDTRALGVWESALALVGIAISPELHEELVLLVQAAASDGVVFRKLREYPEFREALCGKPFDKEQKSILARAKLRAGASVAAQMGTNRHTAWEHRGTTGELIGTPDIQAQVVDTEHLLAEAGLERVPGLSERVVRNLELKAAGRFDDILLEQRTGRLLIADLKTKAGKFYSMTTIDAQLAGYAYAEWMLPFDGADYYVGGPRAMGVDPTEGVVLHAPSDGGPVRLRRADLSWGFRVARLAREVVDARAYGKSAGREKESWWIPAK
jgi:hypothetical protein